MSECLCLPPENPVILEFSGPDAIRYLNGQLSQDVSDLGDDALPACVTDAKGKLQFFVSVCRSPRCDSLWVVCPRTSATGLHQRLERYLIADEVEITDLSGEWQRAHASTLATTWKPDFSRNCHGPFGAALDLWWSKENAPPLESLKPELAEAMRIDARIPAWGHELKPGMLAPEAGLDRSAISYTKGCYIGQEVLSRMKTAGKLNRRLAAFELSATASEGTPLMASERELGELTSISSLANSRGHYPALGYLKKAAFEIEDFTLPSTGGTSPVTACRIAWA